MTALQISLSALRDTMQTPEPKAARCQLYLDPQISPESTDYAPYWVDPDLVDEGDLLPAVRLHAFETPTQNKHQECQPIKTKSPAIKAFSLFTSCALGQDARDSACSSPKTLSGHSTPDLMLSSPQSTCSTVESASTIGSPYQSLPFGPFGKQDEAGLCLTSIGLALHDFDGLGAPLASTRHRSTSSVGSSWPSRHTPSVKRQHKPSLSLADSPPFDMLQSPLSTVSPSPSEPPCRSQGIVISSVSTVEAGQQPKVLTQSPIFVPVLAHDRDALSICDLKRRIMDHLNFDRLDLAADDVALAFADDCQPFEEKDGLVPMALFRGQHEAHINVTVHLGEDVQL